MQPEGSISHRAADGNPNLVAKAVGRALDVPRRSRDGKRLKNLIGCDRPVNAGVCYLDERGSFVL